MTTSTSSRRPRVICHMGTSLDGRIVVDGWPREVSEAVRREYERVHESYEADGWICGRVTMEPLAGGVRPEAEVAREYTRSAPRDDFRAPGDFDSFAFAIDASGFGHPDPVAAGYDPISVPVIDPATNARMILWLGFGIALVALALRWRIQHAATTR